MEKKNITKEDYGENQASLTQFLNVEQVTYRRKDYYFN
jgi:hypothetical protein